MRRSRFLVLACLGALLGSVVAAPAAAAPATDVHFTILHTNDFHGQLDEVLASPYTSSNPGMARVASIVNGVRSAVGADRVLLVDAGDEMQGSLLSNLQKGVPTIATYNAMGYVAATFGNHEFDWGQATLAARTGQAAYPYVTANIVKNDTGNCGTAGWTKPDFAAAPYTVKTVTEGGSTAKVAFIGVTTTEVPVITIASATAGLCFKDPAESIIHYYDQMKADGADAIVVLSHLGYADGGYGYGVPVYGDQTLAAKLNTAGKPVNLIVGGHSHTNLAAAFMVGNTAVVQAHYNGRKVGRADVTVTSTGAVNISWTRLTVDAGNAPSPTPVDPTIAGVIQSYSQDPDYLALINQEVGWTSKAIARNYDGDSLMGTFINDSIYNELNSDAVTDNDVDVVFNNSGGLRADISCASYPCKLTYGMMFTILPFGNQTIVGKMTGAQILEVLQQAASLNKGAIQVAGIRYKFYNYRVDTNPDPATTNYKAWAWGAFDACVTDPSDGSCDPLDLTKTYKVATNEFLAPAGGDNFAGFKYMTDITYWGDMLDIVNDWVSDTYTAAHPFNGSLDGRITRDGNDESGSIVPVTILSHNDSHGRLAKTSASAASYTQLATLIKQERSFNPERTLLLSAGDNVQGDSFSYFFKSAATGFAADGTPLPEALQVHPFVKVMNAMGYDAMTLGNHEYNFGGQTFQQIFGDAEFPVLQANVTDDGTYGLDAVGVKPYVEKTVGPEGIDIAILGIGNHRVPQYELPSNILGLHFSDPINAAISLANQLAPKDDAVVALTHIGFTEDPKSVEVDANVDTNLATKVSGIDAIIGGHSHTTPTTAYGNYKQLPTYVADETGQPVLINQAYRYNTYLSEAFLGFRTNKAAMQAMFDASVLAGAITKPTVRTSLQGQLNSAYTSLSAGKTRAAVNQLNAFISLVNAQTGKSITFTAAADLIGAAQRLIAHPDGYDVASRAGQYLAVVTGSSGTAEDGDIKAILDPYVAFEATYRNTVIGSTTTPIDTTKAFTEETNGANLQADSSVWKLEQGGVDVDVHLSGAMTNAKIAATATPATPYTLKVADMFQAMPYENSLLVLQMNGPQLKAVLERAYRNYYYYKYVPGYGGYSYYTTCMLDTDSAGRITYDEKGSGPVPDLPDGNNVVSFEVGGQPVDFADASTYYNVSTVNYLAAGSCNFNNGGATLWPLDQIVADTQLYVRDVVIDYVKAQSGPIAPAIEGRLVFE